MNNSIVSNSIFQKIVIPKFIKINNYFNWNFYLKLYFMNHKLWDIITKQLHLIEILRKQSINNFSITYIFSNKFHQKNQQIIIILIKQLNNNVLLIMQHLLKMINEINPKLYKIL